MKLRREILSNDFNIERAAIYKLHVGTKFIAPYTAAAAAAEW
jgi:hypothetical protein